MNEITLYRATAACWSRRDQTEYDFEAVSEDRDEAEERALDRAHHSRHCVTDHEHLRRVERFVIETPMDPEHIEKDPIMFLGTAQTNGNVVESCSVKQNDSASRPEDGVVEREVLDDG